MDENLGVGRPTRWRRGVQIAIVLAAVGAFLLVVRDAGHELPALAARLHALGPWGPAAFVALYAVAVVALVPAAIPTLAAGALFGLVRGTVLTLLGATIGSAIAFLVSRHVARGVVERRVAKDPRFEAIDRAIGERGFVLVFLLRLSPIFPFSLLNYVLGLTRVRFRDYLLASVGMIPGSVLYVYSGHVAGDVAATVAGSRVGGTGHWLVMGLGLSATVVATVAITRIARRAFARRVDGESGTGGVDRSG